jgi:hypothetical protein
MNQRIKSQLLTLSYLIIVFGILFLFSLSSSIAEWWTVTINRMYQTWLGPVIDFIPFSVMELFFFILIMWGIRQVIIIFKQVFQRQWIILIEQTLSVFILLLATLNVYISTAGLAYNRLPLPIPQFNQHVEASEFLDIIDFFQEDFNFLAQILDFDEDGSVINPYTLEELNQLLIHEFMKLDDPYFTRWTPRVKPMLSSILFTEFHITGVHFAPSTEAMVNVLIPDSHLPFTMAHEIAHAKGVMKEDEANLVAMYVTLQSDIPFIRYSGYYNTFYSLMNLSFYVGDAQAYGRIYQNFHAHIKSDFTYGYRFWQNYNLLNEFAQWVNDTYLKLFGQQDGTDSYVDQPDIGEIIIDDEVIYFIQQFSPYQKLYFYFYY